MHMHMHVHVYGKIHAQAHVTVRVYVHVHNTKSVWLSFISVCGSSIGRLVQLRLEETCACLCTYVQKLHKMCVSYLFWCVAVKSGGLYSSGWKKDQPVSHAKEARLILLHFGYESLRQDVIADDNDDARILRVLVRLCTSFV
jgi:hypothetical protein